MHHCKGRYENSLSSFCYSWQTLLFYVTKCPFSKHADFLTLLALGRLGKTENQYTHSLSKVQIESQSFYFSVFINY